MMETCKIQQLDVRKQHVRIYDDHCAHVDGICTCQRWSCLYNDINTAFN